MGGRCCIGNVRVLREELIHVFQQRGRASSAETVEKEIEARLMMIRYRHQWAITADEIREMIPEVRTMRNTGGTDDDEIPQAIFRAHPDLAAVGEALAQWR